MPFGGYKSFEDCVSQNQDKDDPEAYCGAIKARVEGGHDVGESVEDVAGTVEALEQEVEDAQATAETAIDVSYATVDQVATLEDRINAIESRSSNESVVDQVTEPIVEPITDVVGPPLVEAAETEVVQPTPRKRHWYYR